MLNFSIESFYSLLVPIASRALFVIVFPDAQENSH
jgi:hypothetical protein